MTMNEQELKKEIEKIRVYDLRNFKCIHELKEYHTL